MSQPHTVRAWLVFAAVVAFATVSDITAQERVGPSVAGGEGIAGARKDLENLKSARDAALLPPGGLPRVEIPALPALQPSTPQTTATRAKSKPAETKPGNWLLEAMEKKDEARDARGDGLRSRDRLGKARSRAEKFDDVDEERTSANEASDEERRTGPAAVNPLARYMDEWMSPQDYALLKPGVAAPFDSRMESTPAGVLSISSLGGVPGELNQLLMGSENSAPPARPPPRENPYLQTLKPELPAGIAAPASKPIVFPPVRSTPPTIIPPPTSAPAQTNIPDFAKPPADEKYFKQLKRF